MRMEAGGVMLTRSLRYRNVRADVLDILQKSLRDGAVVGPSWPRGRYVRPRCVLDSSTPFRLADSWRALAPLGSGEAGGDRQRGRGRIPRVRSGVLEGIVGRP